MFRIKICGVTRTSDVEMIASTPCDAIGLNFVPSSPRCLTVESALELSRVSAGRLIRVGVFMNPIASELRRIATEVELDAIQLHGQEPLELVEACRGLPIIKALSWTGSDAESHMCRQWRDRMGAQLKAFLVDAQAPGVGGGTGRIADWSLLSPRPLCLAGLPLILAGGLNPKNVADAIRATRCDGVDAASGVETQPGIKDFSLVRGFASNALSALGVGAKAVGHK